MIWRNLLRRRARTALTVVGVGFGVAAVVALTAVGRGVAAGFGNLFSGSDADLTLTQANAYDVMLSSLSEDIGEQVRGMPQVDAVAGVLYSGARVEDIAFFVTFGYDPDEYAIEHFQIVDGRPLRTDRELILGRGAADNLDKGVGDSIEVYGSAFRIVGVYETGEAFEELGGVITLADAQIVFQRPRQVSIFMVKLRDPTQADLVADRLESQFPEALVSLGSGAGQRQEAYAMVAALGLGIGLIAAVVGALGMMNAVITGVFERTREIGIMRAVGWRRRHVVTEILGESLALSFLGGLLGIALGIGLVQLAASNPTVGSIMVAEYSTTLFLQTALIVFVMGAIAGIGPAWWASRLPPLEALRYEGGAGGTLAAPKGVLGRIFTRLPPTARSLLRRRTRSLLTMAGIGIGVAVVVALGAITEGILDEFSSLMGRGSADLAATQADAADLSLSTIDEQILRRIGTLPEVDEVAGMVLGFVSTPETPILIVFGMEPQGFIIDRFTVTEGRPPSGRGEAMVGRPTAESQDLQIGDTTRVTGRPFKIVGIYESGVAYQDTGIVVDLREAQDLFEKPRQVSYFQVKLHNRADADAVIEQVTRRYPEVAISRSADLVENTRDFQQMETMMNMLSSIAALVGAVGVMNTVLMSVLERTREFGLLRAVGWRRRRILGMVVSETLLLGLAGAVIGTVAGVALVVGLGAIPAIGDLLSGRFTFIVFARAAFVAIVLGIFASIYPAWRATQFQPAEALRYE